VRVASIERGIAARCDRASTGAIEIVLGNDYPASEFVTFTTQMAAAAHAQRVYGEALDGRGCAWVDRGWVDWTRLDKKVDVHTLSPFWVRWPIEPPETASIIAGPMAEVVWLAGAIDRADQKVKAAATDQERQDATDAHEALLIRLDRTTRARETQQANEVRADEKERLALIHRMDRKSQGS
jgi:hypothetical protein